MVWIGVGAVPPGLDLAGHGLARSLQATHARLELECICLSTSSSRTPPFLQNAFLFTTPAAYAALSFLYVFLFSFSFFLFKVHFSCPLVHGPITTHTITTTTSSTQSHEIQHTFPENT